MIRRVVPTLCILLLTCTAAMASGHGAKKPAKKESGHAKSDSKKSGHGSTDAKQEGAKHETAKHSAHVSDVEQLLQLIAGKERRHDPRLYMEFDLGEYRLSHGDSQGETILLLKFHLYGVLHEADLAKFEAAVTGREQRLRDAVLSVVHKARPEQLAEPTLESLKEQLVGAMNRVLEQGLLRDVAFSTFSTERK